MSNPLVSLVSAPRSTCTPSREARDTTHLGTPASHRLRRTGELDLAFDGWELGRGGGHPSQNTTSVEVVLYYTVSGRYVGSISRRLPASPAHPKSVTKTRAMGFDEPSELLAWLREDGRGYLGENSVRAWTQLCAALPWLDALATDRA